MRKFFFAGSLYMQVGKNIHEDPICALPGSPGSEYRDCLVKVLRNLRWLLKNVSSHILARVVAV